MAAPGKAHREEIRFFEWPRPPKPTEATEPEGRNWADATIDERRERRDELAQSGSVWQDEDRCGDDIVPCGVCDECVDQGALD